MNPKEQKEDLQGRVNELVAFAKEKEVLISACQQIDKQGRIETTPLYRDLKVYVKDVEFKTDSKTSGTPFPEELK